MELLKIMEPILSEKIMTGDEWTHQIKWDGIRGITYIENGSTQIYTKSGRERSAFYPELQNIVKLLNGHQAVLDGEIIIFDEVGRPSFELIMKHQVPVHYILFDILYLNNKDLRALPLEERKHMLATHLFPTSQIGITDDFVDGEELFNLMKEKNFEGIVSKQKTSSYLPGKKHDQWVKTKIIKKILAVIGGLSWRDGSPKSLLLGIFQEENLVYIGNASLGLTQNDLRLFKDHAISFGREKSPFVNLEEKKDTSWLQPLLTCWVSFLEWTDEKNLRHPKIIGFSSDAPATANGKEVSVE